MPLHDHPYSDVNIAILSPLSSMRMTFEWNGQPASCTRHEEDKKNSRFWIRLFPINFGYTFLIIEIGSVNVKHHNPLPIFGSSKYLMKIFSRNGARVLKYIYLHFYSILIYGHKRQIHTLYRFKTNTEQQTYCYFSFRSKVNSSTEEIFIRHRK